jgi:hypothetical protein
VRAHYPLSWNYVVEISAFEGTLRGKPKDGYHCHRSNMHYKQKLVRVLLDSGSDVNLVFASKDKFHTASLLKETGSTVVGYTSNGIFQTKREARVELNFF